MDQTDGLSDTLSPGHDKRPFQLNEPTQQQSVDQSEVDLKNLTAKESSREREKKHQMKRRGTVALDKVRKESNGVNTDITSS